MDKTTPQTSDTTPDDPETIEAPSETTPDDPEAIASPSEMGPPADAQGVEIEDDPDIERDIRTRRLERPMTDEERLKVGAEMAEALREAEHLEVRKAAYDKEMKDQITMYYEKATGLAKALERGLREGNVEVLVTRNWHNGSVTIRRTDTQEILEERAMTFEERQRTLLDGSQTGDAVGGQDETDETDETDDTQDTDGVEPAPGEPGSFEHPQDPVEAVARTAGKQVGHA